VWIVGPALVFITEAGNHDQVAALVSISAFAPDKGESVNTLIANPPPGAPVPPILPPRDGFPASTARSSGPRLPVTCLRNGPPSWPTH
jgi:hypothetical protein